MARRSITTLLITGMVAAMVGMREATGIGPPPPLLSTEEVVWLSPEPDSDLGNWVVLEATPELGLSPDEVGTRRGTRSTFLASVGAFIRRLGGKGR